MAKNRFDIIIKMEGATQMLRDLNLTKKGMDRLRGSTAGLRKSIGALRNNLLLVSFTFGALIKGSQALIAVYKKQIEAERKLEAGLRNIAGTSKTAAQSLKNYAKQLQETTTFGDEVTISGMAILSTFQLTEATIRELTPRMLDMAAAMGTDVQSVAIQLGKAFTGTATALSRSGVVIDEIGLAMARMNGPAAEAKFLLGELDKNFKGFAEAVRNTPVGELESMKMALGDLNEELGKSSIVIDVWWTSLKAGTAEGLIKTQLFFKEWSKLSDGGIDDTLLIAQAWNTAKKQFDKLMEVGPVDKSGKAQTLLAQKILMAHIAMEKEIISLKGIHHMYQEADQGQVKFLGTREAMMKLGAEMAVLDEQAANGLIKGNELHQKRLELDIKHTFA